MSNIFNVAYPLLGTTIDLSSDIFYFALAYTTPGLTAVTAADLDLQGPRALGVGRTYLNGILSFSTTTFSSSVAGTIRAVVMLKRAGATPASTDTPVCFTPLSLTSVGEGVTVSFGAGGVFEVKTTIGYLSGAYSPDDMLASNLTIKQYGTDFGGSSFVNPTTVAGRMRVGYPGNIVVAPDNIGFENTLTNQVAPASWSGRFTHFSSAHPRQYLTWDFGADYRAKMGKTIWAIQCNTSNNAHFAKFRLWGSNSMPPYNGAPFTSNAGGTLVAGDEGWTQIAEENINFNFGAYTYKYVQFNASSPVYYRFFKITGPHDIIGGFTGEVSSFQLNFSETVLSKTLTLSKEDTFTASNGTALEARTLPTGGGTWETMGASASGFIASNTAQTNTNAPLALGLNAGSQAYRVEATLTGLGGAAGGLAVRGTTDDPGTWAQLNGTNLQVGVGATTLFTEALSTATAVMSIFNTPDGITVTVNGTQFQYTNAQLIGSVPSNSWAGFRLSTDGVALDNWRLSS